ncbi:DMT family transporter [candidate division KSB1 bacterium]
MPENTTTKKGIYNMAAGSVMLSFSPVLFLFSGTAPFTGAFYRMVFGGIILTLMVLVKREKIWKGKKQFYAVTVSALLFAINLYLFHKTIGYAGGGIATLLGNFQVFVMAGFGFFVLGEKLNFRLVLAIPLAVLGIAMIIGFDWTGLTDDLRMGVIFGLTTAFLYGLFLISLRKTQKLDDPLSPMVNIALLSILCSAILAGMTLGSGGSLNISGMQSIGSLLAYGVFGQVLGHICITKGLAETAPSIAGLLHLLQPALMYVWDIVIFSKETNIMEFSGFLIAMGAVYLGSASGAKKI